MVFGVNNLLYCRRYFYSTRCQFFNARTLNEVVFRIRIRIRIHLIHMFLGLPHPDPLGYMDPDPAPDPDPDPSIINQKK
jgi:hypothetical protein